MVGQYSAEIRYGYLPDAAMGRMGIFSECGHEAAMGIFSGCGHGADMGIFSGCGHAMDMGIFDGYGHLPDTAMWWICVCGGKEGTGRWNIRIL